MSLGVEWRLAEAWLHTLQYTVRPSARVGQGSFGKVFIGENIRNGQVVAVKFSRILHTKAAEQEVAALNKMRQKPHTNVMQLLEVWRHGQQMVTISEYAADDLQKMLGRRAVSPAMAWMFSKDGAAGLAHLHQANIVHRDLKPANLLTHFSPIPVLKIGDFGSVCIEEAASNSKKKGSLQSKHTPAVVAT